MKLGLIGYPLGHSWSPEIHKQLIQADYALVPLKPEELEDFVHQQTYDGFNVTIPYKQTIMPLLDEIDPVARKIGAVNCVVKRGTRYIGYNTDYYGFQSMIRNHHIEMCNQNVAVLGSGGASKAVLQAVVDLGGKPVIVSRTKKENGISYEELYDNETDYTVLVNTTPVGMFPNMDDSPVDLNRFSKLTSVVDIVANPLCTKLMFLGKQKGLNVCGGFEMLVGQAFYADELFLNHTLNPEMIQDCMNAILRERRNIVLIGMPTSGKTTLAEEIGRVVGKKPVEMDEEIVKKLGTSISECFKDKGEAYFRQIELAVAKEHCGANGEIISCGGGVVTQPETMRYLSQNGLVIWINRNLASLFPTSDRPLSSDIEHLKTIYETRKHLYQNYSDIVIDNNGTLEETVQKILHVTGMEK